MPNKINILSKPIIEKTQVNGEIYDDGYLRVEYKNYYLACGSKTVKLARVDFLIASLLIKEIGNCVSPKEIWRYMWNGKKTFNNESLKVHICRLRPRLAAFGIQIQKKIGGGYRLVLPKETGS